jgi:hypothetical protein
MHGSGTASVQLAAVLPRRLPCWCLLLVVVIVLVMVIRDMVSWQAVKGEVAL